MFNIGPLWQWLVLSLLLLASLAKLAFHFFPSLQKRSLRGARKPATRCGGCSGCDRFPTSASLTTPRHDQRLMQTDHQRVTLRLTRPNHSLLKQLDKRV